MEEAVGGCIYAFDRSRRIPHPRGEMTRHLFPFLLALATAVSVCPAGDFLVEDGEPRAEIVIAQDPPRSTRLAAHDLQTYVEKISGARLPITFTPDGDVPVQIYVGESVHAEKVGVTAEGLEAGAYRIVSGDGWLALIGDDTDFVPIEPWARNNSDRVSGKLQAEWEKKAGYAWGVPNGGMYKERQRLPGDLGLPEGAAGKNPEPMEIWNVDERGSYNAVCGFLRESRRPLVPARRTGRGRPEDGSRSRSPKIDETVDAGLSRPAVQRPLLHRERRDDVVGHAARHPPALRAHDRPRDAHDDAPGDDPARAPRLVRALRRQAGQPARQSGSTTSAIPTRNSSTHTVRWARAQFDIYDFETVSIMPPDAYIAICQCELCEGKDVARDGRPREALEPRLGFRQPRREGGRQDASRTRRSSAAPTGRTPSRPPTSTSWSRTCRSSSSAGGGPATTCRSSGSRSANCATGWLAKTDNPIMIFENYPFTDRGWYLPAFTAKAHRREHQRDQGRSPRRGHLAQHSAGLRRPRASASTTSRSTSPRGCGGAAKTPTSRPCSTNTAGSSTARPAGEMQAFFDYCEANWQAMETDADKVNRALALFAAAKAKRRRRIRSTAKRVALIDDFLDRLRSKAEQLGQKRGPVPKLRTVWDPKEPIVIDGKLDDQYWRDCPVVLDRAPARAADRPAADLRHDGQGRLGSRRPEPLLRDSLRGATRREAEHRHDRRTRISRSGTATPSRSCSTPTRTATTRSRSIPPVRSSTSIAAPTRARGSAGSRRPRSPRTSPTITGRSRSASR